MANAFTGDYEAALQIAIRQVNGVLGTLHQNGAIKDAALQLPHSMTGGIGDPRRTPPDGGVNAFEDWVIEFQRAGSGHGLRDIQVQLIATAPPGAARMLTDAFEALRASWPNGRPPPPPEVVRGFAKLQVSTVTITVPDGSSSEITVHAGIRAQYYPDSGTTDLPAPIHGDVHAAFEVRTIQIGPDGSQRAGRVDFIPVLHTRLLISPSSQDAKIQFTAAPGSGLSAFDENALAVQVRKVLRENLVVLPVDLPSDFRFTFFKGLGSGSSQAIALPFQLSNAPAPASGVQPLNQSIIGSSGFAFAVSSDFAKTLIDIAKIQANIESQPLVIRFLGRPVTYHLRFSQGPDLQFQTGEIQVSGRVEVETDTWWAPNGFVSFSQLVRLMLDTPTQTVFAAPFGMPTVDQRLIDHQMAVDIVRSQIHAALAANEPSINGAFANGRNTLLRALRTFDPLASVSYTGLEITPDGVIVRGEIGSAARRAPVVQIAETDQSSAFTAFESWIPAGRIDRFIWSWLQRVPYSPWQLEEKSFTDEHRFIFPKPAGGMQLSQICLRIEGSQTLPGGQEVSVAGGTTCSIGGVDLSMDMPSWWEPMTVPIWQANVAETTLLRNAIAAHVSVQENVPGKEPLSRNVLVYFADWASDRPLSSLNAALPRVRNSSTLMVIIVLPAGAFDATRREVESRLGFARDSQVLMQVTEDDEGGWTRMFAVAKRPSAYLINARREFVWKHEGEPDPAELAAALNQHLVPTSAPRFRPLRLAISQDDPAPDAFFETHGRGRFALHRFRGREVLLNFWQSWSAPCLAELGRLQRLQETGKGAPFIVAFHGGNNSDALDAIRKRLGLSFALVQDSQQRIATRYGVRCWPTTILVDADGRAQQIQFGIAHEQLRTPGQSEPAVRPA
jgi:peroxiredoxin